MTDERDNVPKTTARAADNAETPTLKIVSEDDAVNVPATSVLQAEDSADVTADQEGVHVFGIALTPSVLGAIMLGAKALAGVVALALVVAAGIWVFQATRPTQEDVKAGGDISFQISSLESAAKSFKQDLGVFPADLKDLVTSDTAQLATQGVDPLKFNGPYIDPPYQTPTGLPENPYGKAGASDWRAYWTYDPATGEVHSAVDGKTTEGVDIKTL